MRELKELIQELKNSLDRWEHLKKYGGQDPFWEDGCNMNLVRNHMFNEKRRIKELCEDKGLELPEIYYKETPPEVDQRYMARVDEIRERARKSLKIYENDKNFQELEKVANNIKDKNKKQIAFNILGYKRNLKYYIETDDLVGMRRHLNYEGYLESAKNFMETVSEEDYAGQVSMF